MKRKSSNQSDQSIPSPFVQSASNLYFEAMELLMNDGLENGIRALQLLEQAYKLEPENLELQLGYIEAYNTLGIHASIRAHVELAYHLTHVAFPTWPDELEWGVMENRPYLRAIQYKADWLWDQGETESAIELYKLLLQLNPYDNQGVRYILAAIYAGMSGAELDALWERANTEQKHDLIEDLLDTQNKKHQFWTEPEEAG